MLCPSGKRILGWLVSNKHAEHTRNCKKRGVSPGNSGRIELVRALQREEDNFIKLIYIKKVISPS